MSTMKVANPVGKKGEDLAVEFLSNRGYRIIDRNVKVGHGELDIITTHNNTLVFIEVKTRTSKSYGEPIESIGYHKLKSLINASEMYRLKHKDLPEQMRIDAVVVDMGLTISIEHIQNLTS